MINFSEKYWILTFYYIYLLSVFSTQCDSNARLATISTTVETMRMRSDPHHGRDGDNLPFPRINTQSLESIINHDYNEILLAHQCALVLCDTLHACATSVVG